MLNTLEDNDKGMNAKNRLLTNRLSLLDMSINILDDSVFLPANKVRLSPKKYLEIVKRNPLAVSDARFVVPKLGSKHFGYFEVSILE